VFDFCFLLDLLLSFNTAVEISNRMVSDWRAIAARYVRGWLCFDLVAAIPVVSSSSSRSSSATRGSPRSSRR
jgi:hypothetical protein